MDSLSAHARASTHSRRTRTSGCRGFGLWVAGGTRQLPAASRQRCSCDPTPRHDYGRVSCMSVGCLDPSWRREGRPSKSPLPLPPGGWWYVSNIFTLHQHQRPTTNNQQKRRSRARPPAPGRRKSKAQSGARALKHEARQPGAIAGAGLPSLRCSHVTGCYSFARGSAVAVAAVLRDLTWHLTWGLGFREERAKSTETPCRRTKRFGLRFVAFCLCSLLFGALIICVWRGA